MGMLCLVCGEIRAPLPSDKPDVAIAEAVSSNPTAKRGRPKKNSLAAESVAPSISDLAAATNAALVPITGSEPQIRKHADSLSAPVQVAVAPDMPTPAISDAMADAPMDEESEAAITVPTEPIAPPKAPASASLAAAGETEKAAPPAHPVAVATSQKTPRKRHKTHRRHAGRVAGLTALLVLIVLGYSGYRVWAAYQATSSRISSQTTARGEGTLLFSGPDFLSAYNSNMAFKLDYDRGSKPAVDLAFTGLWAKQSVSGEARLTGGALAVKLVDETQPVIRYKQSGFLTPLRPEWYRAKADASLYDNVCENREPAKAATPVALYRLIRSSKPTLSMINPFARLTDGWGVYAAGDISSTNFTEIATQLASLVPAGCDLNTFGFAASDAGNLRLHYQVWSGSTSDRVVLILEDKSLGSKLTLDATLTAYGAPVAVTIPATAIDLNQIQLGFRAALARDLVRHHHLDAVAASLDTFYTRNARYPALLSTLVPRDASTLPVDPTTGKSYTYTQLGGGSGYDLIATLEDTRTGTYNIHKESK